MPNRPQRLHEQALHRVMAMPIYTAHSRSEFGLLRNVRGISAENL
jgi:hypothetical protein